MIPMRVNIRLSAVAVAPGVGGGHILSRSSSGVDAILGCACHAEAKEC